MSLSPLTLFRSLMIYPQLALCLSRFKSLSAQGALLRNLTPNTVIAPQHLSPQRLLTPYLPQPDLSQAYPLGPPKTAARTLDPFVRFGLDPLDASPMNPWLRTEYCTTMGKIKSRGKTGLQRGSQRRMGKAVRRARVSRRWTENQLSLSSPREGCLHLVAWSFGADSELRLTAEYGYRGDLRTEFAYRETMSMAWVAGDL